MLLVSIDRLAMRKDAMPDASNAWMRAHAVVAHHNFSSCNVAQFVSSVSCSPSKIASSMWHRDQAHCELAGA